MYIDKFLLDNKNEELSKKLVSDLFCDANSDEVYYAKLVYRDDLQKNTIIDYNGCFKSYLKIKEMIDMAYKNYVNVVSESLKEEAQDICYWNIAKYKLINDEYKKILCMNVSVNGNVLGVEYFYEEVSNLHEELYENIKNHLDKATELIMNNKFSYNKGDIIVDNLCPFQHGLTLLCYIENGYALEKVNGKNILRKLNKIRSSSPEYYNLKIGDFFLLPTELISRAGKEISDLSSYVKSTSFEDIKKSIK